MRLRFFQQEWKYEPQFVYLFRFFYVLMPENVMFA